VIVSESKIDRLRAALGDDHDRVCFRDMAAVGVNPARIIPAWQSFVDENGGAGRRFRGIGEPISPERDPSALVECQRHEALLNMAFAESGDWWLLCPYDVTALGTDVVEEAARSHPSILDHEGRRTSPLYRDPASEPEPFGPALPAPVGLVTDVPFTAEHLSDLRRMAATRAAAAGLSEDRIADFVLAVSEVAANSIRHGGGRGVLRLWEEPAALVCEAADAGHLADPLAGRAAPRIDRDGGRGLWMANQLCDLMQIRSGPSGTVVRLRMAL
jgi:anti-sigma regulatory factor (Ser/Thr protein kinase)